MEKRTVTVKGSATVSVDPDMVVLSFEISAKERDYAECVDEANRRLNALRDDVQSVGIAREHLKTRFFDIAADYEKIKEHEVFKGYEASHRLALRLPMDKEKLNQVLNKITKGESRTHFYIGFDVSDKQAFQMEALIQAVQDARTKAEVLAQAAGADLGQLISIEHGWAEVRIRSSRHAFLAEPAVQYDLDVQPDQVKIEDSATLVWAIE